MNVGLWIVQGLLAVAFAMAGVMKGFTPLDQLAVQMPWINEVPGFLPRFIGFSELAGAIGLILPAATRIKPVLTPLAGLGLVIVMILGAGFHLSRGEFAAVPINVVLGGLAGFVWWGRSKKARIEPR